MLLYLKRMPDMTKREREVFCRYTEEATNPIIIAEHKDWEREE